MCYEYVCSFSPFTWAVLLLLLQEKLPPPPRGMLLLELLPPHLPSTWLDVKPNASNGFN